MQNLLIGTVGWEHAAWHGGFYPEALPADWRFCYYSNKLRAVIVPAADTARVDAPTIAQWQQDSDEAFRFVWELPDDIADAPQALARIKETIAPLAARSAGWLWRPRTADRDGPVLASVVAALGSDASVCVDIDPASLGAPTATVLTQHQVGYCWHVATAAPPRLDGRLTIALMPRGDPRAVRAALEQLAAMPRADAVRGLFFSEPATSAKLAEQARMLADMLGV